MKLIVKNLLQAKSCSFAAVAVALTTMAASNAAAEKVRVFNETVTGVPAANPVVVSDNVFSPEFTPGLVVQGIDLLENPSGLITQYGYLSDGTNTEPDHNTYLILDHNPGGPTPDYDYGRHFLFQGHENSGNLAYITRINLDVASPDHRITLLTPRWTRLVSPTLTASMGPPGIRLLVPCCLPRKPAQPEASSRWARILIRTLQGALVYGRCMEVSAGEVTKASIRMTRAISGSSRM